MKSPYHPDLDDTVARRRTFYERSAPGTILAIFQVAGNHRPSHLRSIPDYRRMCEANIERFAARAELADDWVPVAQTHLGMGLFGAIFGSPIRWMAEDETSWSAPPLPEWPPDLVARLRFDPEQPMVALARRVVRHYTEVAEGRFGVGVLETIDALNLAVALRGPTQAYADLYLYPAEIRDVMERGLQWNIAWLEMLWQEAGQFEDGWCTLSDWLPRKTVWLSVDAETYCRPAVYAGLSRPYMQRLADHFGACWQHLHAPGIRLLPEIVKLTNLVGIQIGDDLGHPRPFEQLRQIQAITGPIPLQVGCTWEEFCQGVEAHTLPGNVEYHVAAAPSVGAANQMAAAARRYQDPQLARTH